MTGRTDADDAPVIDPRIAGELREALAAVRSVVVSAAPSFWPEFGQVLDELLPAPLPPYVMIPLAMTRAAGGTLQQGVPFAAAWTLIGTGVRILDDCADQDSPRAVHVERGMGRALNLGTAMLTLAGLMLRQLPAHQGSIFDDYLFTSMRVWAGQDRDMRGGLMTGAEYLRLVDDKTGCAFAFAASAGARMATNDEGIAEHCRRSGHHVGVMLQLLDDLEACWFPESQSDLAQGKLTFPIWLALEQDTPESAELRALVQAPAPAVQEARILELLDALDIRRAMLWAALDERDRALDAIGMCHEPEGRALLQIYMDHVFRDVTEMLAGTRPAATEGRADHT